MALAPGMAVTIEPGFYQVPAILADPALTGPLGTKADNPTDALTLSMDGWGEVNLPAIAKMLDTDEADARKQLGNLVFEVPPLSDEQRAVAEKAVAVIAANPDTGQTSVDWVFSGGDAATGPSSVLSSATTRSSTAARVP